MTERVYGAKYDRNITSKDVAARVRADIKAAIQKGDLPTGLKVSVRYASFAGGSSVDARITAWPEGYPWLNPEWVVFNKQNPQTYSEKIPRHTKKATRVLEKVEAIRSAYNHDGSDSQTDHFDVKYYGSTEIWWELERPEANRIYQKVSSGVSATPSSNSRQSFSIGDEVAFESGELMGLRFIVANMGNQGPKSIREGLSLDLQELHGDNQVYADGHDLNQLLIVKPVPSGMKVLRFKR